MASPKRPESKAGPEPVVQLAIQIKGIPSDQDQVIVARAMEDAVRATGLKSLPLNWHRSGGIARLSAPARDLPGPHVLPEAFAASLRRLAGPMTRLRVGVAATIRSYPAAWLHELVDSTALNSGLDEARGSVAVAVIVRHQPGDDIDHTLYHVVEVPEAEGRAWLRVIAMGENDSADVLAGHVGAVRAVAVTPDGAEIVSASNDGMVAIWNRASRQLVRSLRGHRSDVVAVAVTPDGVQIVSGSAGGTVRIWDRATGRQVGDSLDGHRGGIHALAVTPDGSQIISGGDDGRLIIWDRATGSQVAEAPAHGGWVRAVAAAEDGMIISASDDGTVRIWDRASGLSEPRILRGGRVPALVVSPDGARIIAGADDGAVYVWDRAGRPVVDPIVAYTGRVLALAVTPDGRRIVSAGEDGTVRVWDIASGKPIGEPWTGHIGPVHTVAVTPDGRQIVSGGDDGTVRVWELERRSAGRLAEVVSDVESAEDRLGIAEDVSTIAAVVGALSTRPPLSVALLGDWGMGKSSFMRQVQDRVEELAARSREGRSAFAANVRQVRFNAWHYSDDHLWVGLVEHLFRELAKPVAETAERINDLEARLSSKKVERDRLETDLRAVDRLDTRRGWLGTILLPLRSVRVARAALGGVRRELRAGWWRVLVAIAVGVGAVVLLRGVAEWVVGAAAVVGAVLAPVVPVWRRLGEYTERARRELLTRKSEVDSEICETEERLSKLDPARRLDRLLEEISTAERYEKYRGLTGRIHEDLRRLSDDLGAARRHWEDSGATGVPPVQRIVLYVDDLDRCAPARVVDVLQAVNLLLTMELFVVVVAVDPRWLLRSLERHHAGLFDDNAVAYLDKIFHIPVALRPMGEHALGYLRSLLPLAEEEPAAEPVATPAMPAATPAVLSTPQAVPRRQVAPYVERRREVHLNPEGLRLKASEREFLARLTPLLSTPRAVKKLVNLYRLLRLGVPEGRLGGFVGDEKGGPYQAAALLLAVLVGKPQGVRGLVEELATVADGQDIVDALKESPLRELIVRLRKDDVAVHGDGATYREWAGIVARYGFETYDLFAG